MCNGPERHLVQSWSSQPSLKKKQVNIGDLMLSSAITLSGNNYAKVDLVFKFANLGMVSESAMYRMQTHCVVPVVNEDWLYTITAVLTSQLR